MSVLESVRGQTARILVINPNSSGAMSIGMKHVIDSLDLHYSTQVDIYTAPFTTSPASIDDAADIEQSSAAILGDASLVSRLHDYDGVVVACYSVDPLVAELSAAHASTYSSPDGSASQHAMPQKEGDGSGKNIKTKKKFAVTGIFEASIVTALSLLSPPAHLHAGGGVGENEQPKWGIVTTGAFWEDHLTRGVLEFLGQQHQSAEPNSRFAGVYTTGLNAGDFHEGGVSKEEIERRLKSATLKCLAAPGGVQVIIMGCAGMAGLEGIIRAAAAGEYSSDFAYRQLHVIDAVRAGVMQVEQLIKHQRLLQ